jgi:hypothetical protein
MKLGLFFETIEDDDRQHLAITIFTGQEEYQEALENGDPAAAWMEVFLKALQENSGGIHQAPTSNKLQ